VFVDAVVVVFFLDLLDVEGFSFVVGFEEGLDHLFDLGG